MDIEKHISYEGELRSLNKKHRKVARLYFLSRREYGRSFNKVKIQIAKSIGEYQKKKPNIGIEMAELMCLKDAIENNDSEYIKAYQNRNENEASYKGLAEVLEAIKSQKISIQSIMKNRTADEKYDAEQEENEEFSL